MKIHQTKCDVLARPFFRTQLPRKSVGEFLNQITQTTFFSGERERKTNTTQTVRTLQYNIGEYFSNLLEKKLIKKYLH